MKRASISIASLAVMPAVLLCAASVAAAPTGQQGRKAVQRGAAAMPAREEINRSYRLAPGARVSVTGIGGPVYVSTGDTATAKVHIIRRGLTQRDLLCNRIEVTQNSAGLKITNVPESQRGRCKNVVAHRVALQEVRLVLPRRSELHMSQIGGDVSVAEINGLVSLDSIGGHVTVTNPGGAEISSLGAGLSLTLAQANNRGVRVSSVNGPVDVTFGRNVNADVRLSSVSGSVRSLSPNLDLVEEDGGSYRLRLGAGGREISLSSIGGRVRLRRS